MSYSQESKDFFEKVYMVVREIPVGRVTTYGAIAKYLGSPKGARMVGWAMNASHTASSEVPAQRVVNRLGLLTGKHHFENPFLMQEKLEQEGVKVKDDRILEFKEVFWDPYELDLD